MSCFLLRVHIYSWGLQLNLIRLTAGKNRQLRRDKSSNYHMATRKDTFFT